MTPERIKELRKECVGFAEDDWIAHLTEALDEVEWLQLVRGVAEQLAKTIDIIKQSEALAPHAFEKVNSTQSIYEMTQESLKQARAIGLLK